MRRKLLFIGALCALCGSDVEGGESPSLRSYLEGIRQESRAPSISVAVAVDGEIAMAMAVGFSDVENKVPATVDTQYRTYSITKAITAVALMQQRERGAISLLDDIRTYVPQLPPGPQPIRLIHLATHTSGMSLLEPGAGEVSSRPEPALPDKSDKAVRYFAIDPLEFKPGTAYHYSSTSFNLLADVIQSVSGQSYAAYLSQHVFGPAGMTRSEVFTRGRRLDALAEPYYLGGWRMFKWRRRVKDPPDLSGVSASAAVVSTPTDLVKLIVALDTEKLLGRAAIDEMFAPPFPEVSEDQAIGWYRETLEAGELVLYAAGRGPGFAAYVMYLPQTGVAGALLVNLAGFENRRDVLMHVMEPYFNASPADG